MTLRELASYRQEIDDLKTIIEKGLLSTKPAGSYYLTLEDGKKVVSALGMLLHLLDETEIEL